MNFEQFFTFLRKKNFKNFNPKKLPLLKLLIKNYYFNLETKLRKLKLGSVTFDIKYFFFSNILLLETVEMRYTRQDLTEENELKIENRLEALKWKWDFPNIAAFILISFFIYLLLKHLSWSIFKYFFYSFVNNELSDEAFIFSFTNLFNTHLITSDSNPGFIFICKIFNKYLFENIAFLYFKVL